MELTKKERRLLINQFEILKIVDPEEKEHYEQFIEILSGGYTLFYSDLEEWLSDDMPMNDCVLVIDILDLYRAIEAFKIKNEAKRIREHFWGYFQGFDGNDEGSYMSFARFVIDKQQKFQEQEEYRKKTDGFNSHRPTLDKYINMVEKWNELEKKHELSEEEILEILES